MSITEFLPARLQDMDTCVLPREEIAKLSPVRVHEVKISFEAALIANRAILKAQDVSLFIEEKRSC